VKPGGFTIISGGTPTQRQMAALASALTVLLEDERAPAADPLPAAYRSRWRCAGIAQAISPFVSGGGA
jgi:hypothetical protein